ncbi:hypothetical protein SDC9_193354 [bioreactor metagenome]|uniref:Uncharacterized protein n=1 Tax=bioreactor metagenome TaxID=1076179 RepID=A0A645I4V0_9ZZZZ
MKHAVSAFERLLHAHDLFHIVVDGDAFGIKSTGITDDAKNSHIHANNFINLKSFPQKHFF